MGGARLMVYQMILVDGDRERRMIDDALREELDLEHHVRRSALPQPGHIRDLLVLCGRLHSTLLDRHRPLWEMHLIEGLEDGRYAIYFKVHHSVVDGVSALRMLSKSLSDDPDERDMPAPWAPRLRTPRQRSGGSPASAASKLVGDAVHAIFNAPLDLPGHPQRALAAARAILAWTERFQAEPVPRAAGFGRTRIGLESGLVVVGAWLEDRGSKPFGVLRDAFARLFPEREFLPENAFPEWSALHIEQIKSVNQRLTLYDLFWIRKGSKTVVHTSSHWRIKSIREVGD